MIDERIARNRSIDLQRAAVNYRRVTAVGVGACQIERSGADLGQ